LSRGHALEARLDWKIAGHATIGVLYSGEYSGRTSDNAIKGSFEASF
jgi:hypothetical protein